MAKITYQGEAESIEWHGQTFARGKVVETDNEALIAKAQHNRFFKTVAMVDKQTKAEILAEQEALKAATEQAQADAEEEARRVLALNAGEDLPAADGEDEAEKPAAPRRGRPRNS